MRTFLDRDKAGEWLAGAVDGIRPRTRCKALVTVSAGLLALVLAGPAMAETNPEPLDRDPGKVFVLVDDEPHPLVALPQPTAPVAEATESEKPPAPITDRTRAVLMGILSVLRTVEVELASSRQAGTAP